MNLLDPKNFARKPQYSVAHSPDADDIFMFYALKFGWLGEEFLLKNTALDIQTLNLAALRMEHEITAISFALYPKIRQNYALLRTAMSFGRGYGPKIVKKRGQILKKRFKVALSGQHTSNALIFRLHFPDARPIFVNFLDIEATVLRGEADCGVIIHENILNFSKDLIVHAELWDLWRDMAGDLPLPLGGMAMLRSVPLARAIRLEKLLQNAILCAQKSGQILKNMLLERGLLRVSGDDLQNYLDMYANTSSVALDPEHIAALDKMFLLGYDAKIYDAKISAEDFLIPREYENLRYKKKDGHDFY